jgi:2-octaprenyl-6-methoxyphenol hydroxylase
MAMFRPSFTPNRARSPRCPCPATAQAWSGPSGRKVDAILALPRMALNGEVETPDAFHPRSGRSRKRAQAWPLSSLIANSFGAGPDHAGRRNRACLPADRSSGPQSWPARHHAGVMHDPGCRRTAEGCRAPSESYNRKRRAGCHQPHSRGRSAQPGAAEFVSAGAGPARRRSCRAVIAIPPLRLLAMREGMTPGWRRNGLTKSQA